MTAMHLSEDVVQEGACSAGERYISQLHALRSELKSLVLVPSVVIQSHRYDTTERHILVTHVVIFAVRLLSIDI